MKQWDVYGFAPAWSLTCHCMPSLCFVTCMAKSVAALVRFWEEAQHLGIQWSDGSLLTVYVTPARDAMLAALLDAAQNAAGRPIPVLAEPTLPGISTFSVATRPSC